MVAGADEIEHLGPVDVPVGGNAASHGPTLGGLTVGGGGCGKVRTVHIPPYFCAGEPPQPAPALPPSNHSRSGWAAITLGDLNACCEWTSVEEAREDGARRAELADEWVAYPEENGCSFTDGC